MKIRWISVAIAALAMCGGPTWAAGALDWQLEGPTCSGSATVLDIHCGDYGVFRIGQATSTCDSEASGREDAAPYSPPPSLSSFPEPSHVLPAPQQARRRPIRNQRAGIGQPGGPPAALPWIAVIDYSGPHGDSTAWLTGQVAGTQVDTFLSRLDDPAVAGLGGDVTDFHVLAGLCAIAELVDSGQRQPPILVNMSFGRAGRDGDPASAVCSSGVPCQIAKVIEHLGASGTKFVAAAGNHGELLFPASLSEVLAAGMLDVDSFVSEGVVQPAGETPDEAGALVPGNALCLGVWAAPAGSSYASALMTGWLAKLVRNNPNLVITTPEAWRPQLTATGSVVLAHGDVTTNAVNGTIQNIFAGLAGGYASGCWSTLGIPTQVVPLPGPAEQEPEIQSLAHFNTQEHPTPESDPCVPCVVDPGTGGGGEESLSIVTSLDMVINMSHSPTLVPGAHLDSAWLKVGASFYPLALTAQQLFAIETANVSKLVISGAYDLAIPGDKASLWYRLKPDVDTDCNDPNACYWSSTPILLTGQ